MTDPTDPAATAGLPGPVDPEPPAGSAASTGAAVPTDPASTGPLVRQRLAVRFTARTDKGLLREINEDSFYAGPRVLAVADGMGGHAAGEVASSVVIDAIAELDRPETPRDVLAALEEAVATANERLRELVEGDQRLEGMGTTLSAIMVTDTRAGLVHVGDSRVYLLRDGTLSQITRDHTLVQLLVDSGRLTAAQAEHHPQRSMLTRALDGRTLVQLDLEIEDFRPGDRVLLCTDGLSGVVDEAEIQDLLRSPDAAVAADRLIQATLRNGAPDNVSCVIADIVAEAADGSGPLGGGYTSGATALLPPAAAPMVGGAAGDRRPPEPPGTDQGSGPAGSGTPTAPDRTVMDEASAAAAAADAARPARSRRRRRRLLVSAVVVTALAGVLVGCVMWVRSQWYVGEDDGTVAIYRGVPGTIAGLDLSRVSETTEIQVSDLTEYQQEQLHDGIPADSLANAREITTRLTPTPTPSPLATPSPTAWGGSGGATRRLA